MAQDNPEQIAGLDAEAAIRASSLQAEMAKQLGVWITNNPGKDTYQESIKILNALLEQPQYRVKATAKGAYTGLKLLCQGRLLLPPLWLVIGI